MTVFISYILHALHALPRMALLAEGNTFEILFVY